MNRLLLMTIIFSFLGCTWDLVQDMHQDKHQIVQDMHNAFLEKSISGQELGLDREEIVANRNEEITNVVRTHLEGMEEFEVVDYLINAGFRVDKIDEEGRTNINDGTRRNYENEGSKRNALESLQGDHYYRASQSYDRMTFSNFEAVIIFEFNADQFVRLDAFVFSWAV